jgi:hypothetical protein
MLAHHHHTFILIETLPVMSQHLSDGSFHPVPLNRPLETPGDFYSEPLSLQGLACKTKENQMVPLTFLAPPHDCPEFGFLFDPYPFGKSLSFHEQKQRIRMVIFRPALRAFSFPWPGASSKPSFRSWWTSAF